MKKLLILVCLALAGCDQMNHEACRRAADNIQYYQACMDEGVCKLTAAEFANYKATMAAYKQDCDKNTNVRDGLDPSGAR